MLKPVLAVLLIGTVFAAPLPSPPTNCPVIVLRDYELGWAYYAQLRLTPECPYGGSARVRKTSTTSTKVKGATYQPIRPETGAWIVNRQGDAIPNPFQFTLNSWAWEYFDGKHWVQAEVK